MVFYKRVNKKIFLLKIKKLEKRKILFNFFRGSRFSVFVFCGCNIEFNNNNNNNHM